MLPLKIIKDLGVQYATPKSKDKTRFILFECPECNKPFKATPCKVKSLVIKCCGECGNARHSNKIDTETNTLVCSECETAKPLEDFYKNSRRKLGYDSRCKSCMNSYKASWVLAKNPNYVSLKAENSRLVKRYGISSKDYQELLEKQDYCCAICGNTPEEGRGNTSKLNVDHCHETGKIRGLLCHKCNTGLGLLGDTKEGLLKALNYLGT